MNNFATLMGLLFAALSTVAAIMLMNDLTKHEIKAQHRIELIQLNSSLNQGTHLTTSKLGEKKDGI